MLTEKLLAKNPIMETESSRGSVDADFTARDYQVELFQAALDENIIVYLPTGSGKTFIAALLIKEKTHEVTKPLDLGGKRTVFLVPTIVLAIQQAAYLRRHTYLKVKEFYGSMGVDIWGKDRWKTEFEENHVLVMTAQIFVDILNHAFFSAYQLNLLVFDECHAAVKDAPMKQVLSKLRSCESSRRPKILGLTAALFRMRCKPQKVPDVIRQLSESMGCIVKIPSSVETVYRSSTKPCEIVFQYDDEQSKQNPDSLTLSAIILDMVFKLVKEFRNSYGEFISKDESDVAKHPDKIDILLDTLKDIDYLLRALGPYGAYHCAHLYIHILQRAKSRVKVPQFLTDLNKVTALCQEIKEICTAYFAKFSPKDRLLLFTQPKVIRLLDIIRKFNSEKSPDKHQRGNLKMCAIVFVERRCMANVLYHFLKDIAKHDETLKFMKPLFIMGQASGRNPSLKETKILNMKQNEIMTNFREGRCNLIVATSVLEEGVDIPACNLIIRFDRIKTYCDYVQTKGRARSRKAFYCLLVSPSETDSCLEDLAQFHSIEQQLLAIGNVEDDRDSLIDNLFYQIIPPYVPYGEDGPRITLPSSISLVNRYCGQLSSDPDVLLAPKVTTTKVDENEADPAHVKNIKEILKKLPKGNRGSSPTEAVSIGDLFQCRLILPLNSPLREEIIGDVMPTKRLAKRAVALKACIMLHELKELDDVHLFPIPRLIPEEEDEELPVEDNANVPQQGHENVTICNRRFPACFSNCRPIPGQPNFVYLIDFMLMKPCLDLNKLFFPFAVDTKLAILTSQVIPAICPFPLVTRSGEFQVNLCGVDSVILDDSQLEKLEKFHQFIFQDVIFLWKRQLDFDLQASDLQYLIVPVQSENEKLDFVLIEKMINAPTVEWEKLPLFMGNKFSFEPNEYVDAVIVPSYKPLGTLNTFYVDGVSDLTPLSAFPDKENETYASYFFKKYNLRLTNENQQLVQVSREITGKNFLVPRLASTKKEIPMHLVPELCNIHPLPGPVWKQVVWIPSVLHRLNGMLVAEELRVLIFKEANLGIDFLPGSVNVSSVWCPLKLHPPKSRLESQSVSHPMPLTNSLKTSASVDSLDLGVNMIWHLEYDDTEKDLLPTDSAADQTSPSSSIAEEKTDASSSQLLDKMPALDEFPTFLEFPCSIEDQKRKWADLASEDPLESQPNCIPEMVDLKFDVGNPSTLSVFGPSPGIVLEALTLAKAHDGYDMERLETIGDSILKLIISIYVYGEASNSRCDEGRLTLMRMRQISNKHLFHLGQKKGIGEFTAAQRFDLMLNFRPPGFKPPVADHEPNLHVQQFVQKKNVADSMEALIGVYLLTTGIKGAIKLMNWMGLKTVPNTDIMAFNPNNGFPVLSTCLPSSTLDETQNEEQEHALMHLYTGLESFEKRLRYTFKNKALLVEALTHASYLPNRITNCYQRLEFLGDAVLDYLVTRFYFDNPCQYSPAILTDLRSAVVNNETFAIIAVKNRFHLYLKHLSLSLNAILDRFIRAQEENGHLFMHNYFVLEETSDPNEQLASNVDVPKVLGDIFESVAGAIFLDSGMSLDAVWQSYLPFLHDALENFNESIPVSALRKLYERHPNGLKIRKSECLPDGRICVAIEIEGTRLFKGAGGNSKTAKSAAAKYALSVLNNQTG
ncbi:endoribonuclease Dicer-like [Daphnia carinata]|uniref:endoribonuclease Dicer-like n=1 Tax=Daphnia carinata TaxID=120202 RepID=UPI00257D38A0|nr:endoribonuclease Dicer-like [Daphnia carinata]